MVEPASWVGVSREALGVVRVLPRGVHSSDCLWLECEIGSSQWLRFDDYRFQ